MRRQRRRRRRLLKAAARFVGRWEGFLGRAYLDTIAEPNVWTIGYGHTAGVEPGDVISHDAALRLLAGDLTDAAQAVARYIDVPLTRRQRMALMSFVHNCGPGALEESTLRRVLNERRYREAADQLLRWNKAGGVEVFGLTRRRRAERRMFLSKMPRGVK